MFRKLILIGMVAGLAAPMPAGAASCGRWTTTKADTEEGRQWVAGDCSTNDKGRSSLELMCAGKRKLQVRYLPKVRGRVSDRPRRFVFVAGKK